jgi:uncharacterized protein (TIGR02145 family)
MNNEQLPPILDFNYETNNGTLFDTRDGQSYPVVKIGNQIWLAENFRYLPTDLETNSGYESCVCYAKNLEKGYGRLYDRKTANLIAPEGWHLPSKEDFNELIDFIVKDNELPDKKSVAKYIKSNHDWIRDLFGYQIGNGNDKYGFNALPEVYGEINPIYDERKQIKKTVRFYDKGIRSTFWCSGLYNNSYQFLVIDGNLKEIEIGLHRVEDIIYYYNVRLIKDIK